MVGSNWEYIVQAAMNWSRLSVVVATSMLGSGALARQGPPPLYGIDFVRVGEPGNRAATAEEAPMMAWRPQNKHGQGLEGYWTHPGMSDVPLIPGPPRARSDLGGI